MKKLFVFLSVLLCCLGLTISFSKPKALAQDVFTNANLNYTETTETVNNPDIGFMHREGVTLNNNGVLTFTDIEDWVNGTAYNTPGWNIPQGTKLMWFNIDLKNYSPAMGGTAKDITQKDIEQLEKTFAEVRRVDATCIVRFSYDMEGVTYKGDNSPACEPSLDWVIKHVKQLGAVITKYADVITCVQSGMFGAWGEQHSTTLGNRDNVNSFYQLVKAWLEATPSDMPITVRRPQYFLHWYNTHYNKSYTVNNMNQIEIKEGTLESRIGCYNDGYLGNSTDTGTYLNREKEVGWLTNVKFVPFGGEVLQDSSKSGDNKIGNYNSCEFLEVEGFKTHTSYLNYHYNYQNVIKYWEQATYDGKDSVYKNKVSDFQFIRNRLGYRLVLRDSQLTKNVEESGNLKLKFNVENVGFGNVTKGQNVYIVIADANNKIYSINKTNINCKDFLSQTTKTVEQSVNIGNLAIGKYKVYLKIINSYEKDNSLLRTISFANNGLYNKNIGGNLLGDFEVVKKTSTSSTQSNPGMQGASSKSNSSVVNSVEKDSSSISASSKDSSSSTQVNSKVNSTVANSVEKDSSSSTQNSSQIKRSQKSSSSKVEQSTKKGCSSQLSGGNLALFILSLGALSLVVTKRKNSK